MRRRPPPPSSTRETSRISTFGAAAENSEPATKRMAPIIRLFFRPSLKESQPLPTAPTAAPNIMELTTHSPGVGGNLELIGNKG